MQQPRRIRAWALRIITEVLEGTNMVTAWKFCTAMCSPMQSERLKCLLFHTYTVCSRYFVPILKQRMEAIFLWEYSSIFVLSDWTTKPGPSSGKRHTRGTPDRTILNRPKSNVHLYCTFVQPKFANTWRKCRLFQFTLMRFVRPRFCPAI